MPQRELLALLIAVGVHVAFLRVAGLLPDKNLLLGRMPGDGEPVEVEVLREEAELQAKAVDEPTTQEDAVDRSAEEPPADERLAATDTSPGHQPPATPDPAKADPTQPDGDRQSQSATQQGATASTEGPSDGSAALPAPGSANEYDSPPPGPGPVGPGAGPIWAMPGGLDLGPAPAAPTRAPGARPVDAEAPARAVASTLRDRDQAVGITMPSTAVVTSAVSVATRSVPVPHNTRATFEVKLGPGGKVVSSRVIKHSGGGKAQWDAAAKSVAASLAGRSLELGDAAKTGATVIVNVTTKHVFPSGTAKAADVKPVCANQIINDLADGMDKSNTGTTPEPVVPLFQDENGKPCIPIGVAGVSDTANIGATKQVQVQTSSQVLIDGKKALPANIQPVNKDPFWVDTGKGGPRPVMPFKARKYKRDKEKKK